MPELAADETSLSWLASSYGSALGPSVGRVWFKLDFLTPIAVVVAVLGLVVLVGTWYVGEVPVPDGGAVPTALSVGTAGEAAGSSWWNMTHHMNGSDLMAVPVLFPTLVVVLGASQYLSLPLDRGESNFELQNLAKGDLRVQRQPVTFLYL